MTGAQKKLSKLRIERSALIAAVVALIAAAPHAQDRSEPTRVSEPSALIDYSTVQGVTLRAHVFEARTGEPPHPAILFFHGGRLEGWIPSTVLSLCRTTRSIGIRRHFDGVSCPWTPRQHRPRQPDGRIRRLPMGTGECRRTGHRPGTHRPSVAVRRVGTSRPRSARLPSIRAWVLRPWFSTTP